MASRGLKTLDIIIILCLPLLFSCDHGRPTASSAPRGPTSGDAGSKPLRDAVAAVQRARTIEGTFESAFGTMSTTGRFEIQRNPFAAAVAEKTEGYIAIDGFGYKKSVLAALRGGKWTKEPLTPATSTDARDDVTMAVERCDPLANIEFIAAAFHDFKSAGTEAMNNASARHFVGTFKKHAAFTDFGVKDPRQLEFTADSDHPRFELWIDNQNQIRRFTIKSDFGSNTVTVSAYDQSVAIKAPASGSVKAGP
jgi:hypothetical protein